jgi:predicted O-linked N-acetylglucosamine transferase (SPINDLY family)
VPEIPSIEASTGVLVSEAAPPPAEGWRTSTVLRAVKVGALNPPKTYFVLARESTRPLQGYIHALCFIEPILSAHDHNRFDITCYANVARPDCVTERLQGYADRWRSIVEMSDAEAADLIRRDAIDILVDLTGHTGGNRLLVFARKPAPIQVSHFGYPATTGLATIDYRITDAYADPPGLTEAFYTEQLIRLPEIAWCYQPPSAADVHPPPFTDEGHVTFACFNNLAKITANVIALWSRIMAKLPDARLVLLTGASGESNRRVLREFAQNGIGGERVQCVERRRLTPLFSANMSATSHSAWRPRVQWSPTE